ncbi:MAG: TrpR-like protein YerC/YecD [Christensenellaceae bacterium]|jgi:TrpR-related protein YerC/YecD|nr:TrpR-like protein YerC/YecD [Christensenellaceae bacterium]
MYSSRIKSEELDGLFRAILTLQSEEDCYRFFEDLCTIHELQSMAQRMGVAAQLDEGLTYAAVAAITGASSATISRVSRCLCYGADGYRRALDRLKAEETGKEGQ